MLKTILLISCILSLNQTGFELRFLTSYKIQGSSFKIDILGNVYTIENGSLVKYSETGERMKEYNNKHLGTISYYDVSDPFRILLFYKDFNQVLFIDNYFAEIMSPIRLDGLKMEQAEIACSSPQGGFWVYDSYMQKLIYFDKNLQKQQESIGLNSLAGGSGKPTVLFEKNDFLFMNVPDIGIFVFDRYGAYFKTLRFGMLSDFQVSDGKIIYQQGSSIFKYDLKYISTSNIDLPDSLKDIKSSGILKDKLYLMRADKISVYKVTGQ